MPSRRSTSMMRPVFEWLLFVTVAVWVTWPLANHLSDSLPLGSEHTPTVPLFNLWTIWWNVDRVEHAFHDYWNAPIFYPARNTFAFSEPQVLTGVVAWPLWKLLPSPEAVYNTLLLLNLTLNGHFAMRWLRGLRLAGPACIVGGLFVELLPFVHWQLGVFQVVPVWGIIMTFAALERSIRRPSAWNACCLGVAFTTTYLLCSYYGVMLSLLLCCCVWPILGRRIRDWQRGGNLLLAGAVALLLTLPVTVVQYRVSREHDSRVPRAIIEGLSVPPTGYLHTPWRQYLPPPFARTITAESPWALSPGTLKLLLAGIGAYFGLCARCRRRFTLFALLVIGCSVLLSLGPRFPFLYDFFGAFYPGFRHLRNIYRFAVFAQLMTAALAALGLHFLYCHCVKVLSSRPRMAVQIAFVALATLSVSEATPPSPRLFNTSALREPNNWVDWLSKHTEPESVVALIPFPKSAAIGDYVPTAQWMYLQMYHHRRMVNGYSAVFPEDYLHLQARLSGSPFQKQPQQLTDAGVDYLVLAEAPTELSSVAETVFADPNSRIVILRLR